MINHMEIKTRGFGFSEKTLQRQSGLELLKLITLFAIVISHCALNMSIEANMITIDSSTGIDNFFLIVIRQLGHICNDIFFLCSAWFMLGTEKRQSRKAFKLAANIWVIYFILLIFRIVDRRFPLYFSDYLMSLLPTSFMSNWYASTYIFFLLLVLPLNSLISRLSRKTHLKLLLVLSVACLGVNYLFSGWNAQLFFNSYITLWIYLYLLMAYLKKYLASVMDDVSFNRKLLLIAVLIRFGGIALMNVFISRFHAFENLWMIWETKNDPFFILMAISLFNIFRKMELRSPVINALSSLSLYVYVIHDNLLLKNTYRHLLFEKYIARFGLNCFSLKLFPLAMLMFFKAVLLSYLYRVVLEKPVSGMADRIYGSAARLTDRLAERLIRRSEAAEQKREQ